ncbi:preprotein translocase subunit SecA [Candidatus Kaiserbacteria bacterium CG10_big_fil_rev_8_21_14_0_10_45_20]|uniref:Protein translocase subunit SecA n=1 Tax=Candidatus Kaiserbacteria bacterium CG10_big_fil_rev_8_21_14_0_10_45_20 TaxID=1974607 RepID=A0A2H0UGR3_9BACT|nr:MAG: preprotein translocase subunit SecA [Candidatus Kaiserbacteria bacterium CG10_big_fil_rev_8_21_14_0_10_45_20]
MALFSKLFSSQSPLLKEANALVPQVSAHEEKMKALSDEDLRALTDDFRARLQNNNDIDTLLPEAFAAVREASRRTLGERHYDVQIIGGYVLHKGAIAEMRTGEGKTLVATLPAYVNALSRKGVHVITVNDYLARRDGVWMGQIYHALGLTLGIVNHETSYIYDPTYAKAPEGSSLDEERDETGSFHIVDEFLRPVSRKEAYRADITYGTNNEFGFDYLRDNLVYTKEDLRQRTAEEGGFHFAIIDEVDSILIDEARTPLIISGPVRDPENFYQSFATIAETLSPETDYTIDEKLRAVQITDAGIEKAEKALGIENLYTEGGVKFVHHLDAAVRAKALFTKDKEYVVKDGQIVIVDEFTGRLQPGRRWSEGLHQAIEAKEGLSVQRESQTYASITFQNYFRMYEKRSGMTGTGLTSQEEFRSVYNLDVAVIPTHRDIARIDHDDLIFKTEKGKFTALAREVKERNKNGQPVLIGTTSIEVNERLSTEFRHAGIPHEMLNAKNHEREGEIIAQAGRKGGVTIATNMAGRGVDIKLGGNPATKEEYEAVKALGGLYVVGTERHDARRIDNQLRGRAGRQGDPGETQFFVSLEDKLMRIFASGTVKSLMDRLGIPEDEPIQNRMISRSLESAQEKIEGVNFDSRKHVLGFDDVLNHQRQTIYAKRRETILSEYDELKAMVKELLVQGGGDESLYEEKEKEIGTEALEPALRRMLLQAYDMFWIEHLQTMDYLRSSVNLRSYGGRDPFIEYRREGLRLFRDLEANLAVSVVETLPRVGAEMPPQQTATISLSTVSGKKLGRNDIITITNGEETKEMKFKKAEELLKRGWRIVDKK